MFDSSQAGAGCQIENSNFLVAGCVDSPLGGEDSSACVDGFAGVDGSECGDEIGETLKLGFSQVLFRVAT
jgi:hypothetical protein